MFGRGNWAILGVVPESHEVFRLNLSNRRLMLATSQAAASALTTARKMSAVGINPFSAPRIDEIGDLSQLDRELLAAYACVPIDQQKGFPLTDGLMVTHSFAWAPLEFELDSKLPWYGFWFVTNEWKDINDTASLKEANSYVNYQRPYRFLGPIEKKEVDQVTRAQTAPVRKQFPVLIDFAGGRIYVQSTNKDTLTAVQSLFETLGVQFEAVCWSFGPKTSWPGEVLNKLYDETHHRSAFERRAADASRFAPEEQEKLDDPELAAIVRDYFSMSQLETETWIGQSTPAQVRLHPTMDPIVVQAVTNVTTLSRMTDDSRLAAAVLHFQERSTRTNKKGEERIIRRDLLQMELSDRLNLTEVGAALLLNFDLPGYKKDVLYEIRKSKRVPSIQEFWFGWLHHMMGGIRLIEESLRATLELKDEPSGIRPLYTKRADQVEVTEG